MGKSQDTFKNKKDGWPLAKASSNHDVCFLDFPLVEKHDSFAKYRYLTRTVRSGLDMFGTCAMNDMPMLNEWTMAWNVRRP